MKPIFLSILAIIFISSCNQKQEKSAPDVTNKATNETIELSLIMKTIEGETTCFFQRDYECWKNYWINADYAFQAWSNDNGTFDASTSFDTVSSNVKKYMEKYPLNEGQTASHPEVFNKNVV